jgi:hypothetical protein
MKMLFIAIVMLFAGIQAHAAHTVKTDTYGIHLFFNEKEFVDVLALTNEMGLIHGTMHVPDDFDGPVLNYQTDGLKMSFDLLVPKNAARPEDMIFHYEARFFDAEKKQLTGFVTIKDSPGFVASFTGFQRP